MKTFITAVCVVLLAATSSAQFGQVLGGLQKAKEVKDAVDTLIFTEAEERELGEKVSVLLREKYGVVQDKAVHKYVTLVGSVLAKSSSRPNLPWTFIVLDTDGVNAFATPGGFVHVTRGALALMQNEAELAGVLGHEVAHVTGKHTVNAIKKNKMVEVGASMSRNAIVEMAANKTYEVLLENAYNREDEMDADKNGATLANGAGYAPTGIGAFLTRLSDRNKDLQDRSGLFASHPDTKARLDALTKLIASQKLNATATVAARFRQFITYTPVPVSAVASGAAGAAGLTGSSAPAKAPAKKAEKAEEKAPEKQSAGSKFGLGGLNPLGREKAQTQTVASGGSRGVNPDRDARGGSNSTLVTAPVTSAEIAEFRKGIV
jgi:predicted Zn-dependent protease